MSVTIKLYGLVDGAAERAPELAEMVGQYLTRYEPERAPKGEQWIWTTDDRAKAARFDSIVEAHGLLKQSIGTRPWDGKPNRPITVFHIEVAQVDA